jgi:very-short-patch-repair endonuclease
MDIDELIRQAGGLAPTWMLLRGRGTGYHLTRAIAAGRIVRVRQGWYALPGTPDAHLRAWRVGGRLSCSIGAREHGIWTRSAQPPLHVSVRPTQSRLRRADDHRAARRSDHDDDVTVHWTGDGRGSRFVATPLRCLLDMTSCEPSEFVVAAADCAIGLGLVTRASWMRAVRTLPARLRNTLAGIDPKSGSLTESLLRVRLTRAGIPVRSQVQLTPDARVDFVVGGRLVVEVDGADHADVAQMRLDRRRDLEAHRLGFATVRYSGVQVLTDWPAILDDIRRALRKA